MNLSRPKELNITEEPSEPLPLDHEKYVQFLMEQEIPARVDEDDDDDFYEAILAGDTRTVKKLLRECPRLDINKNKFGYLFGSPLNAACAGDYADIVRLLLAHPQISPSEINPYGPCNFPPMDHTSLNCLKLILLDSRFKFNQKHSWDNSPSPWFRACHEGPVQEVKLWIAIRGSDIRFDQKVVFSQYSQPETFMEAATKNKDQEGLQAFVRNRASVIKAVRDELKIPEFPDCPQKFTRAQYVNFLDTEDPKEAKRKWWRIYSELKVDWKSVAHPETNDFPCWNYFLSSRSIPRARAIASGVLGHLNLDLNRLKGQLYDIEILQNSLLMTNFEGRIATLADQLKHFPLVDDEKGWEKSDLEHRCLFMAQFHAVIKQVPQAPWLRSSKWPVVPMFHGTVDAFVNDIRLSGFSNCYAKDDGWFGKGIYFTSNLEYALNYAETARDSYNKLNQKSLANRVVIVAFILPGRAYPVTESPHLPNGSINPNGYFGKAWKTGYQSHYSLVSKEAFLPIPAGVAFDPADHADELVIFESAQALPFLVLSI